MVRDLAECAYRLVKAEKQEEVKAKATATVEKKLVKILAEIRKADKGDRKQEEFEAELLDGLRKGYFDTTVIEVEVLDAPKDMELPTGGATIAIGNIFGDMFPQKKKKRKLTVKEAMQIFLAEEAEKLVDDDAVKESSLMKLIKLLVKATVAVWTFPVKGYSVTFCLSWKAAPWLPNTAR